MSVAATSQLIPKSWTTVRFRYLADIAKGKLPPRKNTRQDVSVLLPYLSMEYLRDEIDEPIMFPFEDGLVLAKEGDILLLWDGSNAGEFMRSKEGVVSSTIAHVNPKGVSSGYFYWACKSLENIVRSETVGMGIPHVSGEFLANIMVPLPEPKQQRAIADYLDKETARIDALVAAKERVLNLLDEKRRALITRAVTKGIDPNVKMKDSGIPWLGEIPVHWPLIRAKYLWHEQSLPVRKEDDMVTCFRDGQVTLRKNRRIEGFTNAIKELGYQGIRTGHLVLHSMDAFAGAIGVSDSDGKCTPEYIICDPARSGVENAYFGFLLRVMALNGFIQASCPAVRERAPRIHFSTFGRMFFPLPHIDEQKAIVAHIKTETSKIDALRAATERTIELLKERRSALIAAAVTGKIQVEGAA